MTSQNSLSQQEIESFSNLQDEGSSKGQLNKVQRGRNSISLPQETISQLLTKTKEAIPIKKQEDDHSFNQSQSSQLNQFGGNNLKIDLSNYSHLHESNMNEFSYDDDEDENGQSRNITIGGIPLQNIYENSEWIKPFQCYLCNNVAVQPIRCSNCSGLFCKGCLLNWESTHEIKKTCPKCLQLHSFNLSQQEAELKPDYNTQKFLQDINVDCVFKKNGCQEIVSYAEYEDHIKSCPKRSKICLNCGENFVFDQAELHKNLCQIQSIQENKSYSDSIY